MRNIQNIISLCLLYQIVQCEIPGVNLANNFDQSGNTWKTSANSANVWSNAINNGKPLYNNQDQANYATEYRDKNVRYGYHIRNGDAEVWVNANIDHTPWNNNYNVTSYNNDWNQVQSSWNNGQSSSPQLYYYPKPSESTTSAPTTTAAPTTTNTMAPEENSGYTYVPQTNYFLPNLNGVPNDFQSVLQQTPVIDLTKPPENNPKPLAMPVKSTISEIDLTKLPENNSQQVPVAVPIKSSGGSPPNMNMQEQPISSGPQLNLEPIIQSQFYGQQQNYYPLPYSQPPSFLEPNIPTSHIPQNIVPSFDNQPFQVSNSNQHNPWFHSNIQVPINRPELTVQQDPAINVNILKPAWSDVFPPFNTNNQNGKIMSPAPPSVNFPILNTPPMLTAPFPTFQNEQRDSQIPNTFSGQPDITQSQHLFYPNSPFSQKSLTNLNVLPVSSDLNIVNNKIKRSFRNSDMHSNNQFRQRFNGHAYPVTDSGINIFDNIRHNVKEIIMPNLYVNDNGETLKIVELKNV